MTLGIAMITFDTLDPDRLADWWAEASGGEAHAVMPGEFVQVILPDGTSAQTQVRIDTSLLDSVAELQQQAARQHLQQAAAWRRRIAGPEPIAEPITRIPITHGR